MNLWEKINRHSSALVLIGLIAATAYMLESLLTHGKWFVGAQAYRYPYMLDMFRKAIDAGIFYPRWLPELMSGYGYPTFLFYQPGTFYFSLPFTYLFSDMGHAMVASLFAMLLLGSLGIYKLSRLFTGKPESFCCALLFLAVPYFAMLIFQRGNIGELLATMITPWALYYLFRLQRRYDANTLRLCDVLALAFTLMAMIISHPFVSVYALPTVAVLAFHHKRYFKWNYFCIIALCFAAAAALSAPYWLTIIQLYDYVEWGRAHRVVTMKWPQLLFLGTGHTLLALLLLLRNPKSTLSWVIVGWMFFLVVLLGPWGVSIWTDPLIVEYTARLQMTYRVICLLAALVILLIAINFPRYRLPHKRVATCLLLAGSALLISYGLANQNKNFSERTLTRSLFNYSIVHRMYYPTKKTSAKHLPNRWKRDRWISNAGKFPKAMRYSATNMTHTDEFHPRDASKNLPHRYLGKIPVVSGEYVNLYNNDRAPHRIEFSMKVPDGKNYGGAVINQYSFPGWKITMNGNELPYAAVNKDAKAMAMAGKSFWKKNHNGLIQILVHKPGIYEFQAWYDGPPGAIRRNIVILIMLFLAILGIETATRSHRKECDK